MRGGRVVGGVGFSCVPLRARGESEWAVKQLIYENIRLTSHPSEQLYFLLETSTSLKQEMERGIFLPQCASL